jgi:sporulation protein YlmC with PRC-barrel domain
MEPGTKEPCAVNPRPPKKKGEKHADSSVAIGNTDPADHSDHAAAPLICLDGQQQSPLTRQTLETEMKSKYLATALLGTALLTGAAYAQNATPDRSNINTAVHRDGEWRSSKLIGVDVYNDNNEKIGDIQELIVDKSGKVDNVVLGVGGFLGMGEHYVAVPMEKLKWVNEPVRTSSTTTAPKDKSTASANNAGTTTGEANRANRAERAADEKWYPDHAVFNATKDQLKAMPQFKYN